MANDPIRLSTLDTYYEEMDSFLQPSFEKSSGVVTPDGSNGSFNVSDITSTSFVEISPSLTITTATDIPTIYISIILTMFANVVTVSSVAEITVQVNGVNDANVYRIATNASGASGATQLASTFIWHYAVTSGSLIVKPVGRIVSGTTPTLRLRWNDKMRTIVRNI